MKFYVAFIALFLFQQTRNRQKTFMTKGAGKALAKSKLEQGYLLAAYKTDKCLYSAFKKWTAFVHANKTLSVANAHPKVRQAKALKALDRSEERRVGKMWLV